MEWIYCGEKKELLAEQWRDLMASIGRATYQPDGVHLIKIVEPVEINGKHYDPGVYSCG